jgi:GNAT superfamily N-acetyltransferase
MSDEHSHSPVEQHVVVRTLEPDDAAALKSCVIDCYGETYPKRDLYDFDLLRKAIENGDYSGVVAVDRSNSTMVGHIGWVRHTPGATAVEAGATMVRPASRGGGLLKQLGRALHDQLTQSGAAGYVHFPTTAHTVMQRASVSSGGAETGLLLGYLPASLDVAGFGGRRVGRLAVTVAYQPLVDAPPGNIVAASERDVAWLTEVARRLGLHRTVRIGTEEPTHETSQLTSRYTESRDLLTLNVSVIGRDVVAAINAAMSQRRSLLVHIDFDATDAAVTWAGRELATIGFVFGAWLPGWFGSDAMRLQRINDQAAVDLQPELFTVEAQSILERVITEIGTWTLE